MSGFNIDDYVPVPERVEAFYGKFPDGTLQSEIVELTPDRVTVKAYAYRSADDARPGIGHSSLEIPGRTPYTKGSEIENAETSAWGRAIAALGFEVKRGVASREEVRNKRIEQPARRERRGSVEAAPPATPSSAQYRRGELAELMAAKGLDLSSVETYAALLGIPKDERPMSNESMDRLIEAIEGHGSDEEIVLPNDSAASAVEEQETDVPPSSPPEARPGEPAGGVPPASEPALPPKPKTEAYAALPPAEKAEARAYWAKEERDAKHKDIQPEPAVLGLDA